MDETVKLKAAALLSEEYLREISPETAYQILRGLVDHARDELTYKGTLWSSEVWVRVSTEATPRRVDE